MLCYTVSVVCSPTVVGKVLDNGEVVGGVERGDRLQGTSEVVLAPPFVEDTGIKGRGLLMGFAAGAVGPRSG